MVLWTRITPPSDRPVDVDWIVARDPDLTDIVARGEARAERARDWTVKIDVTGLSPATDYYFGFEALGARSPNGRTRTLPDGPTALFKLAVVSCANHPAGWFNVYRDIADRSEADVVVHLGDYIYEYGPGDYATQWGARHGRVPEPPREAVTLADYRARHAQYKADPDLQAAHAAAPWIAIWDDHESANDSDIAGAENHQDTEGDWAERRRAAVQAYLEWMPIREPSPGTLREAVWRTFEIGDLATLIMLETRLSARSPGLTWDDAPVPADADPRDRTARDAVTAFLDDVVGAHERTMLGAEQLSEVEAALSASVAAGKPWQILGNQTMLAPLQSPNLGLDTPFWLRLAVRWTSPIAHDAVLRSRFAGPASFDQWDGYPAERTRLFTAAQDAGAQLLTLTGDTHSFFASRLIASDGSPIGVEIGTSSVTSPSALDGVFTPGVDVAELLRAANPHLMLFNPYERGYVALTLTPESARAELRRVSTVARRDFHTETYAVIDIAPTPAGPLDAVLA